MSSREGFGGEYKAHSLELGTACAARQKRLPTLRKFEARGTTSKLFSPNGRRRGVQSVTAASFVAIRNGPLNGRSVSADPSPTIHSKALWDRRCHQIEKNFCAIPRPRLTRGF